LVAESLDSIIGCQKYLSCGKNSFHAQNAAPLTRDSTPLSHGNKDTTCRFPLIILMLFVCCPPGFRTLDWTNAGRNRNGGFQEKLTGKLMAVFDEGEPRRSGVPLLLVDQSRNHPRRRPCMARSVTIPLIPLDGSYRQAQVDMQKSLLVKVTEFL
jgi:hypothetical protein